MLRKKQILSRHCLVQKNRTIHLTLEGHHWKTKTLLMHFTHFMFCRSQFLCFLLSIMIILHKTWNHQVTKYRFCKENTLLNAVTVLAMWDKAMRKLSWEWSGERERIGLRKTLLSFCFTRFLTVTLQLKLSLCVCDSWQTQINKTAAPALHCNFDCSSAGRFQSSSSDFLSCFEASDELCWV